jgi:hypothetical protein
MEKQLGSLARKKQAFTSICCKLDIIGQVDGGEGSSEVRQHTSHADVQSFFWNILEREGVYNGFL